MQRDDSLVQLIVALTDRALFWLHTTRAREERNRPSYERRARAPANMAEVDALRRLIPP